MKNESSLTKDTAVLEKPIGSKPAKRKKKKRLSLKSFLRSVEEQEKEKNK